MVRWSKDFYYWPDVFSRQTGNNGEICVISGGKGIGKTFGLRLQCIDDYIRKGERFCEICRTKTERDAVHTGYFDKIQNDGFFKDREFKTDKQRGYMNIGSHNDPVWDVICYFVALSDFQMEKKRTYSNPTRFIFDEAVIDKRDRYHRYLPSEFEILANLLDTISRQQPGSDYRYRVYIIGNSCDLTCPYFRYNGIDKIPDKHGFYWYKDKTVLFHYVPAMKAEERKTQTLVGRMLAGNEESRMIFDNRFAADRTGDLLKKPSNARYAFALRFNKQLLGVWMDYANGYAYITDRIPKDAKHIYALTKLDGTVRYNVISKTDDLLKMLNSLFYAGCIKYESPSVRELFHSILGFLGIR